ncbi:hypothetical protein [Kluyvera georgiana]|uniref:hypothetical protein n=1 Tax=Kluyvera georgiana TaxID=73098 RepID=UPI003AEF2E6A
MTNNQLTDEQLEEYAKRKVKHLKGAIGQSAFTAVRVGLEEELQLAEFALLALREHRKASETPAAIVHHDEKGFHALLCGELPEGTPLYSAPQPLNDAERAELQERRKADEVITATIPNPDPFGVGGKEIKIIYGVHNRCPQCNGTRCITCTCEDNKY